MRTAVSIPEAVFQAAERMARRWGISRSELYARAVQRYLEEHGDEPVTEFVNAVCDKIDTSLDPGLRRIQSKSLPRDEWK